MSVSTPKPEALGLVAPELPSVDIDGELQLAQLQEQFAGIEAQPVPYRQWEVIEHLGTGGMGRVYLARHLELDRRVALKLVKPATGEGGENRAQRIIREAQALAQINHENVLAIHQVDRTGERTVIEMEYVEGSTLREWQRGKSWQEIVWAYASAGDGLAAIHAAGLVHRDIKPDNLLVDTTDRVKVADLGLAVANRTSGASTEASQNTEEISRLLALPLTAAGGLVGTHGYMAPEVIAGEEASPASDQFSLAVSLYEALYGTRPFVGHSPGELARAMKRGELAPGEVHSPPPRRIQRLLRRALSFDADRRYPSLEVLVAKLRRRLGLGKRVLGVSGGVFILACVGAGAWAAKPGAEDPCATAAEGVHDIWGPSQRAQLTASDGRRFKHLLGVLDVEAESLATARTQLCASERRHADSPDSIEARLDAQQRACLDHAQRHLSDLVDELISPDFSGRHADFIEAVDLLPSCTQRQQLEKWEPGDEGDELDIQLAQALALHAGGDYAGAAKIAEDVVARSEGSDPLRHAHALYRLGRALGLERREAEASDALERARNQAFAVGHDELMCRASAFQAKVDAGLLYDHDAAQREFAFAQACAQRVGAGSPLLQADLLEARGLLALAAGEGERAAHWHREALALRVEQLGDGHPEVSNSKLNLANSLADVEAKAGAARQLYLEALKLREKLYGAEHPLVAHVLHDLGDFERVQGAPERASELLERAVLIFERADGRYARGRLKVHIGLAILALEDQDLERAREQLNRGASVAVGDLDLRHERAVLAHLDGQLTLSLGDHISAAASLRRARRLYEQLESDGEAALECMAYEIEASYALQDYMRISVLARDGGIPLRARIEKFGPEVRGALAWYAGDALMRSEDRDLAKIYLSIAEGSYAEIGDINSTRELSALLSNLHNKPPAQ